MKINQLLPVVTGTLLLISCAENLENKLTKLEGTKVMGKEETKVTPTIETAFEFVKSSSGIDEYRCTLNGLSILLMEEHSAPVATFMVTYHVGSRNEAIGHTGSTHLLEHMMFKGSKNFNKEKGNPFMPTMQNMGAVVNATTWMDRTNYFELLPSEHLGSAIAIEADRMRNLFIKDEERQREMTVVRNEFERGENDPFDGLNKNIWATAYQAHPYHHNTIGWRSDIEGVSTERLQEFYETYYWPNNATVTIIGDFNKEETLKAILDNYGTIIKSPQPIPVMYTTEPKQEGARRFVVKRSGQMGIVGIAHKTPEGLHEDNYAIQVLSRILGDGKSSRFYKSLVDKGLSTSISMWDYPLRDNGLFVSYVFLTSDTKHKDVEKIILDEYELLKQKGVTDEEIVRAKGQLRAEQAYSRDGSYSIASSLNEAIAIGDWTYYTNYLENINKVTKKDIKRIVNTYLIEDKSTIGYFIPLSGSGGGGGMPNNAKAHKPYNYTFMLEDNSEGNVASNAKISDRIIEQTPIEGIRLLTMKTGVKDVVTIAGSFLGGDVYSPQANMMIANLTASMLDKGTINKSKFEISDKLEKVGASISFSSGHYNVRFNAKCLKDDIPLVLSLLAEQLMEPAFNKEDLITLKTRLVGNLKRDKENTQKQAGGAFLRKLYPKGHPNYSYKTDDRIKMVNNIDSASLKNFHKTYYGLGSMTIVAIGDINEKAFSAEVSKVFNGWKTSPLEKKESSLRANHISAESEYVTIKDKTSADIYIGLPIGIDRNHEDFYPLMFGTYILGGNFSARLMQTVRDEQGLTYNIQSWVGGVDYGNDGYWLIGGSFAPQMVEKGRVASIVQLNKWVESGVTQTEVDAKKSTITGSYKVGLATTHGLAGQILTNAERGRQNSYLDEFPELINAITIDRVNDVIQKYIDNEKLVFVAAGSLDKDGNPLLE
ncbi:M16 family metallopeptidase [Candidatus Neomarinimicrobiota bacterium]